MVEPPVHPEKHLRPEPLPDHAVVIRGGVLTARNLASGFEDCFRDEGVYDISVEASAELDADQLARWVRERDPECEERLPHGKLQESTVGAIRAVGADVVLSEPPEGHYSVRFPASPTDEEILALMAAFEAPRRNPVARRS